MKRPPYRVHVRACILLLLLLLLLLVPAIVAGTRVHPPRVHSGVTAVSQPTLDTLERGQGILRSRYREITYLGIASSSHSIYTNPRKSNEGFYPH